MSNHVRGALKALNITLKNFLRSPVTESVRAHKTRSHRYKSSFALLHDATGEEACIGCKMCEKICPSDVITVVAGGRKESPVTGKKRGYCDDFILDLQACIYCEFCVQVCPTDAIVMLRVQEQPGFSREDLVLTMDRLYRNETEQPLYWGTGTSLVEMQDPQRGMPKPPPKARPAVTPKPTAEAGAADSVVPRTDPSADAAVPHRTPAPEALSEAPERGDDK